MMARLCAVYKAYTGRRDWKAIGDSLLKPCYLSRDDMVGKLGAETENSPSFPVASTLEHRASFKLSISLQFLNPKTVGRIPWTGDQPIAKPLPTQTQTNIHALSGIRTHDPRVREGEESSCLGSRGHCDRLKQRTGACKYDHERLEPFTCRRTSGFPL
jgi:hypothetical protein